MNLQEIKEKIKVLRELKYANQSKTNYDHYYSKAIEIYHGHQELIITPYYTDSLTLYRARKNDKKAFHNLGEIWYPSIYDTPPGRLNFEAKPIFYCSSDATTALIEVRPKLNDCITLIKVGLNIGELISIQLAKEKIDTNTWLQMDHVKREVFQFIIEEIRKPVKDGQFQNYYGTQIFAQLVIESMGSNKFQAIAYNSVATSHKGYNFAIKPEFIDEYYKFISSTVYKVIEYTDSENFKVKCLLNSDEINSYGRIQFRKVDICPYHDISLNNYSH